MDHASRQAQGLATMLNDALQQAERLASENRELRRKQEDAVLDTCAPAASDRTWRHCAGSPLRWPLLLCAAVAMPAAAPGWATAWRSEPPGAPYAAHTSGRSRSHGTATLVKRNANWGGAASSGRKLGAGVCRQLKAAQEETEKVRLAGDAYKRELLQQKLSDTEWALSTEQDRLKEAEADKDGGVRLPHTAARLPFRRRTVYARTPARAGLAGRLIGGMTVRVEAGRLATARHMRDGKGRRGRSRCQYRQHVGASRVPPCSM